MKIKNLKVEEKLKKGSFHLNKRFIATGMIIAGLVAGIGVESIALNELKGASQTVPSSNNTLLYSKRYHEEHPEKYPTLKLKVEHPEAIQTDLASILITTDDNLLIDYIYAYPDGYIEAEGTYLYPGNNYYIQVNCDDNYSVIHFSIDEVVDDYSEINFSYDCQTNTIQLSSPTDIIQEINDKENTK